MTFHSQNAITRDALLKIVYRVAQNKRDYSVPPCRSLTDSKRRLRASIHLRRVHFTILTSPNLVSADLISSEPGGCESTQFAMAATNRRAGFADGDHLSLPCHNGRHWITALALAWVVQPAAL